MNIEKPKTIFWAKLIAMQPDNQNIVLYTDKNEYLLFDDKFKIYKDQDGDTFIKNLSAPCLHIDDLLLEINQEKQLFGGEEFSFEQEKKVTYVFCLKNRQSNLKRDRERDVILESESLKKLAKIENDLQKELACPICTNYFEKCMILTPCQHSFCSFCLFDHLKLSNKCPLCRVEAASVAKNSLLSTLIQLIKENFSMMQKSQGRKELEEISFGGTIEWDEEGVFIGSFVNGLLEGQGKAIYPNGEIYEGSWKNGEREGKGVCTYNDGGKYDGDWRNDSQHGIGKEIWPDGQEYEGDWIEGYQNGTGKMKYASGNVYQGGWKYGEEEGLGNLTFPNGDKYQGRWVNGLLQPEVKIEYSNGEKYDGKISFKDFKKQGEGILILTNGDRYKGNWIDNVLQPQVTIEFANGEKYEGEIEVDNFKKRGKGILLLPNGDRYKGNWIDDVFQPQVTIEYSNGDQYEGEINVEKLQKNGKGVFTFKNGDVYEGNWMNDMQHGQGKEIYRGGKRIFEGVWKEGRVDGKIIMTDIDGRRYQAKWKSLDGENEKDPLSENTDIDDSQTQDSDY